jgi:hypothetical protein
LLGEHFDTPRKEVRREQISPFQKETILLVCCGTEFLKVSLPNQAKPGSMDMIMEIIKMLQK